MARNSFVFVTVISWLFHFSFSQNGCPVKYTCLATGEQCLTMENVALGKMAEISSFYNVSGIFSPPACVVVNGNRNNRFIGIGNADNCAHTNDHDYTGWWQVHLGRNYTIKNITVYSQTFVNRLSEVRVTIDGELCYDFPNQTSNDELSDISCNTPLTGSTVRFEKRQRAAGNTYYLVLCEVEIWVCRPGLYGPSCCNRCNCKNNDTCNNYYGTCPNECQIGWFGESCSQICVNCDGDHSCHRNTGLCAHGCQVGWEPINCSTQCKPGTFGKSCQENCGNCQNSACRYDNGFCELGCVDHYEGNLCKAAKVPVPTIVAAVVPCAVVFAVGIVFILWRIRRKRKQNTTSGSVELPVKPQECISPSESQMVSEDVSETVHNYDTLQTGTAETSLYSAPVFR